MSDNIKFSNIIPVGPKKFAYQQEGISIEQSFSIKGFIPSHGGREPYLNDEKDVVQSYELKIEKFTNNSFTVTLYKTRKDTVEQRKQNGFAVIRDGYQTTFDFAGFVNAIFRDREVFQFTEEEHFPEHIKQEMRKVYDK
jgi:hypothetical protein